MKVNLGYLSEANKAICKILLLSVCCTLYLYGPALGQTVNKQLYLSDPAQALDRVDPVTTADASTTQTASLTPASQYLFAFRGASKTDFWKYNIASNAWTAMAATPGCVGIIANKLPRH